jgi:sulfonate transport system ATP-binding protein
VVAGSDQHAGGSGTHDGFGGRGGGSAIELLDVGKRFGEGEGGVIFDGVSLAVAPGEIVSIVGPSGCGKSTLLRVLAGLDRDHEGQLRVGGRVVVGPSRTVGLVFQEPRLLPWLTVARNIAFGLAPDQQRGPGAARRVATLLAEMQLDEAAGHLFPGQLSGGMSQRAALARALAARPAVLLLDEPFSAVDAFTRIHLQELLLSLWERTRLTMLLVTHEIEEALYLSDRVVVLSERPARVAEVLTVGLARPRDRRDGALAHHRAHLLEALRLAGRAGIMPG